MEKLERAAGVLLAVSSLPGDFAIGDFGDGALRFAKTIAAGGFNRWQILPVTVSGLGNSPYSGVSAFAGNYLYIDPERLYRDGYIDASDVSEAKCPSAKYVVDYRAAAQTKTKILKKAFSNKGRELKDELDAFRARNRWAEDYAVFSAIKEIDPRAFWEWDVDLKFRKESAIREFRKNNSESIDYYVFVQYVFSRQWNALKAEINAAGVGIIGDMPIYVAEDSVEVWSRPDCFLLDENLRPRLVAGVPPDYFSEEGQLWGNPLYDYGALKKDGYGFWLERFGRMNELYDFLRIDHFRGFDRFWAVEAGAENAKEGSWLKADGAEIIAAVRKKFPDLKMIAEDLGTLDEGVTRLLKETGLPGMKVMQFAFSDGDSANLPHNFDTDCVAYTGTHDNDTTLGWFYSLPDNVRDYALDYIECDKNGWRDGGFNCKPTKAMIKTLLKSSAKLAVVPFWDLCGYGSDCRMNIPGVAENNWRFRATREAVDGVDYRWFLALNNLYGRNRKMVFDKR